MSLISRLNPKDGLKDFWSEFRRPNPYRWPVLGVSILMTSTLMYPFIREQVIGPPVPYDITYITTLAPDRSEAEIIASNLEYQKTKEAREALIAASEERQKELYRALARASGMDPDEIERKAAAEKALEEAAVAEQRKKVLGRTSDNPAQ